MAIWIPRTTAPSAERRINIKVLYQDMFDTNAIKRVNTYVAIAKENLNKNSICSIILLMYMLCNSVSTVY